MIFLSKSQQVLYIDNYKIHMKIQGTGIAEIFLKKRNKEISVLDFEIHSTATSVKTV